MPTEQSAPKCPHCGFTVYNKRYPKCERCGNELPSDMVISRKELKETLEREGIEIIESMLATQRKKALERSTVRRKKSPQKTWGGAVDYDLTGGDRDGGGEGDGGGDGP